MGWNSVVVVMNDALNAISQDADFGARLSHAVAGLVRKKPADVSAHGKNIIHVNAATVISQAHADDAQIVVVAGNGGYRLTDRDPIPPDAAALLAYILKAHGWKVSRPKVGK